MSRKLLLAFLPLLALAFYYPISAQFFSFVKNIGAGQFVSGNYPGQADEGNVVFTWYQDSDGDGYGDPDVSTTTPTETAPDGYVADNTDCAPADATKWRSAEMYKDTDGDGYYVSVGEVCYGENVPGGYSLESYGTDDCDDNDNYVYVSYPYYVDHDGDGIGSDQVEEICVRFRENTPEGYSEETGDCNDYDNSVQSECPPYIDADGDGYKPSEGDCNDADAGIFPGAAEVCGNGIDDNCNNWIDEGCSMFTWYQDLDGDGYGNPDVSTTTPANTAPTGYVSNNTDCDDANAAINPASEWFADKDDDGYSNGNSVVQCISPGWPYKLASYLAGSDIDCDDNDPIATPATTWYIDLDGDGFGDASTGQVTQCERPWGGSVWSMGLPQNGFGDCNDDVYEINPWAAEICGNGIDEDCDGETDENCSLSFTWYRDSDGDGYGNPSESTTTSTDTAPDGYVANNTDCNDWDSYLYPGIWYLDFDSDGYGDGYSEEGCERPSIPSGEYWKRANELYATSGDCNDENSEVYPRATEICGNGWDDDCDGVVDEDCPLYYWYSDADGDGYGNPYEVSNDETPPSGYIANNEDCDDNNAAINPATIWYNDKDKDGYSNGWTIVSCVNPSIPGNYNYTYRLASELISISGDCDDGNAAVHPGATEICGNGFDDNCNGLIDEDCGTEGDTDGDGVLDPEDCEPNDPTKWRSAEMYKDDDGDSYFAILGEICYGAEVPDGYTLEPDGFLGDCDDTEPRLHGTISYYIDHDGDGIGSDQMEEICWFTSEVGPPNGYSAETGDCDDNDPNIYPGAPEICGNGKDDNCDGVIDEECAGYCGGQPTVLYVNQAIPNSGNGSGWDCAFKQLSDAITVANANLNITEIWVVKGIYKPTQGTDRTASFKINRGDLKILGGFAGTETTALAANPATNLTTLSGDIGVANSMADNSYHIMQVAGVSFFKVDGFQFEKGNSNNPSNASGENGHGGAIVVSKGTSSNNIDIQIKRCHFTGNQSLKTGGAVRLYTLSATLDSCLFTNNSSANGGALATYEYGGINITNSLFNGNKATAGNGGAIFNDGNSISFYATAFDRNTATANGGAYFQVTPDPLPTYYKQCVFSRNSAARGGALHIVAAQIFFGNCTFFSNTASVEGGAVLASVDDTYYHFRYALNNIFWKNKKGSATNVAGADVQLSSGNVANPSSWTIGNNIFQLNTSVPPDNGTSIRNNLRGTDPLFVNEALPAGADGLFKYQNDGLELKNNSPAKNIGNDFALEATDMLGQNRVACGQVDLGAYENQDCATLIAKAGFEKTPLEATVTNPFRDHLLIRFTGAEKADVEISSLTGQKVWKGSAIQKGQTQVNTASWPSGMYQVTIRTAASKPIVLKVIKAQ